MKKYRVYDYYGHNVAVFFEEKDASDYCNWKNRFESSHRTLFYLQGFHGLAFWLSQCILD